MDAKIEAEQTEAMEFLAPLSLLFHEGWELSHSKYLSYDPEHAADHDDATAAACVRCHMWKYVLNQIDGRPGVKLMNVRGLKLLNYYDRYVLRFKQVDRAGHHSNYPTDQQTDFDRDLPLPGIPEAATRLTSGYQLDAAGATIERIVAARILGRSVLWLSQINVVASEPVWTDITPQRIDGTDRVHANFKARK